MAPWPRYLRPGGYPDSAVGRSELSGCTVESMTRIARRRARSRASLVARAWSGNRRRLGLPKPLSRLHRFGGVAVVVALSAGCQMSPDRSSFHAMTGGHALHDADAARTFLPVADSYVRSDGPKRNFGRSRDLIVEGRPLSRVFIRFHPQGVGSVVQARLRLFVLSKPGKLTVHATNGRAWLERKLTFRNAPRLLPPAGFPEPARTGWLEFDVTALVRLNEPITIALTRSSTQKLAIASRESAGRAPRLAVESERRSAPVVAAAGDVACDRYDPHFNRGLGTPRHCRMRATYDVLRSVGPDVILGLGDNMNAHPSLDEFMGAYDPAWGKLKPLIRPVPGNWEYKVPEAEGYFHYFGPAAGDPLKGYYSFDVGNWHLVALNSNCRQIGGCGPGSPQAEWLRADLGATQARCVLAYDHQPRFASAPAGDFPRIDALWRLLADYGVDVLLSGGHHFYERFVPLNADAEPDARGIRQFVVGTGGHSSGGKGPTRPTSAVRDVDTFGVLRLTLHPDSFEWRFIPEVGRSFSDRGMASCH